jgi:hypothetical protein
MRPAMSRRTAWLLLLSLVVIAVAGLAPYVRTRGDDTVRWGTVIGTLDAQRSALPDVEKKYGLKYDVKDFRDSTSSLLAVDQGELDIARSRSSIWCVRSAKAWMSSGSRGGAEDTTSWWLAPASTRRWTTMRP